MEQKFSLMYQNPTLLHNFLRQYSKIRANHFFPAEPNGHVSPLFFPLHRFFPSPLHKLNDQSFLRASECLGRFPLSRSSNHWTGAVSETFSGWTFFPSFHKPGGRRLAGRTNRIFSGPPETVWFAERIFVARVELLLVFIGRY